MKRVLPTCYVEPPPLSAEHGFYRERSHDVHDVLHVLTGYGRDIMGENALHGFTYAQYGNRAYGLIGAMTAIGAILLGRPDAPRLFLQGYRRGRKAAFLSAVDWNAAMGEPVAELRAKFGLDEPPSYVPMASDQLAA